MLAAVERIERHTRGLDADGFLRSELVQDAVVRNLAIIGEASNKLQRHDPAFCAAHPELPVAVAYQMRNALAHGYFQVDHTIVWRTVQHDLPVLRRIIETLLRELGAYG